MDEEMFKEDAAKAEELVDHKVKSASPASFLPGVDRCLQPLAAWSGLSP
jgi:hypothetical protein